MVVNHFVDDHTGLLLERESIGGFCFDYFACSNLLAGDMVAN